MCIPLHGNIVLCRNPFEKRMDDKARTFLNLKITETWKRLNLAIKYTLKVNNRNT